MGCPPLSEGVVHDNEIDVVVLPVRVISVGGAGTVAGVALAVTE